MKKYPSRNVAALVIPLFVLVLLPGVMHAAPRLIGISGNSDRRNIYEINPTTAATTLVFTPSSGTDTPALGFCPTNGMLYYFVGGVAWQDPDPDTGLNVPTMNGYQDNHYMGKIDLVTSNETGIFNANPCPNPDPTLRCYGLPAPIA